LFEGWAAAAAVVGSAVVGGAISASGAQSAAQTQADAAKSAQQISLQEFNTITGQEQPYMQAGYGALSALDYGLGITPQDSSGQPVTNTPTSVTGTAPNGYTPSSGYQMSPGGEFSQLIPQTGLGGSGVPTMHPNSVATPSTGTPSATGGPQGTGLGYGSLTAPFTTANWQQLSPAYNFNTQQGQQNVLNGEASGQGALSGAAAKDLINFNQANANNSFSNAFNQYQTQQGNIFSRLSGIAQLGQSSAANTGQQGTALAGQAAQSATNVGSALAAGQVGAANAYSGAISSAVPWLYQASQSSTPPAGTTLV
jgi:hypothetical protein